MCVSAPGSSLFRRRDFLGLAAVAAAPMTLAPSANVQAQANIQYDLPPAGAALRSGNARAVEIARRSPMVRTTYDRVERLARSIGDADLRASVLSLLHDPKPLYAAKYRTPDQRRELRDRLAGGAFIDAGTPLSAIFPPGTEPETAHAPQPFWATPGSGEGSHHAYPGGLAVHEYFNATMATQFAQTYDHLYFSDRAVVSRDTVVGAALYHDIMKAVIFQWNDDGTLTTEHPIGKTGGHHCLSGAEAIVRGRSPAFVVTLLCAHASPSLGDEVQVATWCRAAALIAGVDPVSFGLVKRNGDGYVLAAPYAPTEAFINYLSDHDYVFSIEAFHAVEAQLKKVATESRPVRWPAPAEIEPLRREFAWYRNTVLAHASALALYDSLARSGTDEFRHQLDLIERSL